MTFSLNEIEAMGKRAARGGGYSWGIAEEAGKAARWLTAQGLPGPEELADILTVNDGKRYHEIAPASVDGEWTAAAGRLCPLIAGAALTDRAGEIAGGREMRLGPTAQPLLLAPYAAAVARLANVDVSLAWEGARLTFTPEGDFSAEGDASAINARSVDAVRCRAARNAINAPNANETGRAVDAETWSRLNAFAMRTYAPATEASRLAGAGSGLMDND